jgi:N-acetylneuraminic acid mutarotase
VGFFVYNVDSFHRFDLVVLILQDVWEWKLMNHFSHKSPIERYLHTSVVIKNQMIVFGGFYRSKLKSKALGDVWKFNLETYEWQPVERIGITPKERHSHAACVCFHDQMVNFKTFNFRSFLVE